MTVQVEVIYTLYERTGTPPELVPVTREEDIAIEAAIRNSDGLPFVDSFGDVDEQNDALNAHVQAVSFDFPIDDHVIAFDLRHDSRWSNTGKSWVIIIYGGSVTYPVPKNTEQPDEARLQLEVRTANTP